MMRMTAAVASGPSSVPKARSPEIVVDSGNYVNTDEAGKKRCTTGKGN